MATAWLTAAASYLWQVALHASIMGLIFYVWVHRIVVPSGRTKRRLLSAILVLPLITAAIPGRTSIEFSERIAWLNSGRVLAVPLPFGFQLWHLVVLFAVVIAGLSIWQELMPAFSHPAASEALAPPWLVDLVRAKPGWQSCAVAVSPESSVLLATGGMPQRPRVIVSQGALDRLNASELDMVLAHEHAHWDGGRWLRSHALFIVRMLQCYHPVALWVFREYCIEVEVGCDAVAVTGRDHKALARVLLGIYDATDLRDVAARAAIRKRIDVLLAGGPVDDALPPATEAVVWALMLLVLPWIV